MEHGGKYYYFLNLQNAVKKIEGETSTGSLPANMIR